MSTNAGRMKENLESVQDIKITKEEEALITNLDCKMRICPGQKYAHCLFFDVFA